MAEKIPFCSVYSEMELIFNTTYQQSSNTEVISLLSLPGSTQTADGINGIQPNLTEAVFPPFPGRGVLVWVLLACAYMTLGNGQVYKGMGE